MKANNLTETVSLKDIQAVESALKSLREKLPFAVTLTLQERGLLPHPRHDELAMLERSLVAAKENSSLIPAHLDLERFERDVRLVQGLDKCYTELQRLTADVRDTLRTLASDPLKACTEIRAHVAPASKRSPALEDLARRLVKRRGKTTRATPVAASPAPAPTSPGTPEPPPQQKAA